MGFAIGQKGEMMDDTISRQAAIDAFFMELCFNKKREYAISYKGIEKIINGLPSAEPERPFEIQDILDYLDTTLHPIISPEYWNVYSELYDMISTLSSTQTEIIRCKDCKYAKLTHDGSCKYCDIWFPDEAEYMDGDYYCASAERKSNE